MLWYNFKLPPNNANNPFYSFNSLYILRYVLYPINIHSWPGSVNSVAFINFPGILFSYPFHLIANYDYPLAVFLLGYVWQLIGAYVIYYLSNLFLNWEELNNAYSIFAVFFYLFNESMIQGNPFLSNMPIIITFVLVSYFALFKSRRFLLLLGVFSFFTIGNFPYLTLQLLEIFVVLIFLSFLVLTLENRGNIKLIGKRLKELIFRSALSILIIFTSVLFLVMPFLSVLHTYYLALTTPTPSYAFGFWPDVNLKIQNTMRLINNWGYFTTYYAPPWYQGYISNTVISTLLWVFPLMALGSILFIRKVVSRLFYCILIVVIFLSKANNPPFGNVFVWLIDNFAALRPYYNGAYFEPFQLALYLIYSSIFIAGLLTRVNIRKVKGLSIGSNKIISVILIFVIISSSLVSVYPILTQRYSMNNPSTPQYSNLPEYYNNVSNYLSSKDPNSAVMVFPNPGEWSILSNGSKIFYYGANPYYNLVPNPVVAGTCPTGYVNGRNLSFPAIDYIYSLTPRQPSLSKATFGNLTNLINYHDNFDGAFELRNSSIQVTYNTSSYNPYGAFVNGSITNIKPFENNQYFYVKVSNSSLNAARFKIGIEYGGYLKYYGLNFLYDTTNATVYYINLSAPRFIFENSSFNIDQIQIFYMYSQNETSSTPISASLAFALNNGTNTTVFSNLLATLLSNFGIKYAYVDNALVNTVNSVNASVYNELFSSSKYFKQILNDGTVTLYVDTLYNGVISEFQLNQEPYLNQTFTSLSESMIVTGKIVKSTSLNVTLLNSIEYKLTFQNESQPHLIVLKTQYNSNYDLLVNGKYLDKNHFVAFGYSNYWVIPSNTSYVLIQFDNIHKYIWVESLSISIPFIYGILFIIFEVKCIIRRRR